MVMVDARIQERYRVMTIFLVEQELPDRSW
jgi:hypothetical protein